jgi:hypothetical protein
MSYQHRLQFPRHFEFSNSFYSKSSENYAERDCPSRLDRLEIGTIAKVLVRSSTAIMYV